jgi:hypothetical protein
VGQAGGFAGMVASFCGALRWWQLEALANRLQDRLAGAAQGPLRLPSLPGLSLAAARALAAAGVATVAMLAQCALPRVAELLGGALPFDPAAAGAAGRRALRAEAGRVLRWARERALAEARDDPPRLEALQAAFNRADRAGRNAPAQQEGDVSGERAWWVEVTDEAALSRLEGRAAAAALLAIAAHGLDTVCAEGYARGEGRTAVCRDADPDQSAARGREDGAGARRRAGTRGGAGGVALCLGGDTVSSAPALLFRPQSGVRYYTPALLILLFTSNLCDGRRRSFTCRSRARGRASCAEFRTATPGSAGKCARAESARAPPRRELPRAAPAVSAVAGRAGCCPARRGAGLWCMTAKRSCPRCGARGWPSRAPCRTPCSPPRSPHGSLPPSMPPRRPLQSSRPSPSRAHSGACLSGGGGQGGRASLRQPKAQARAPTMRRPAPGPCLLQRREPRLAHGRVQASGPFLPRTKAQITAARRLGQRARTRCRSQPHSRCCVRSWEPTDSSPTSATSRSLAPRRRPQAARGARRGRGAKRACAWAGSDADDGASGADGAGGDGGRSRWAGARTRGAARGPGAPRGSGGPGGRGRGERAFFCRVGTGAVRAACAPAPARRARRTVLFQDAPAHRGASCGAQTRPALCPAPMPRSCAPSQALSTPARSSHAVWPNTVPSTL